MVCNVTKSLNLSESFTFYKEEANYSWCKDFASGCVGFYFHALQWLELHSGKNYRLYVSKIWRSFFFFYSHLLIFYRPLIPENKTLQCQIPFDLETSLIIKKKALPLSWAKSRSKRFSTHYFFKIYQMMLKEDKRKINAHNFLKNRVYFEKQTK